MANLQWSGNSGGQSGGGKPWSQGGKGGGGRGSPPTVLLGPRTPLWGCSCCGEHANWASRVQCRGCTQQAPDRVQAEAWKAHKAAIAQRQQPQPQAGGGGRWGGDSAALWALQAEVEKLKKDQGGAIAKAMEEANRQWGAKVAALGEQTPGALKDFLAEVQVGAEGPQEKKAATPKEIRYWQVEADRLRESASASIAKAATLEQTAKEQREKADVLEAKWRQAQADAQRLQAEGEAQEDPAIKLLRDNIAKANEELAVHLATHGSKEGTGKGKGKAKEEEPADDPMDLEIDQKALDEKLAELDAVGSEDKAARTRALQDIVVSLAKKQKCR